MIEMSDFNKNNEWLQHIEKGKEVPNAIKLKKKIDTKEQLKAKYPNMIFPTKRIVKTFSDKQRKAIRNQEVLT